MSKRKYFPRLIKKSINQWHFLCSVFNSWKKKTQNKYLTFKPRHKKIVWWNAKQFCFWILIYLNLKLGWHCYGFDWVLLWQSFPHPEAWLSFQLHPAIFDYIYSQSFKLEDSMEDHTCKLKLVSSLDTT